MSDTTSDRTEQPPVLLEIVDRHIAVVALNRPEARNAINSETAALIERHLIRIEEDPEIRVGVLAARGDKTFCAGADLKEVSAGKPRALSTERGGFAGFVDAPRAKPWIAAVGATALGGGLELALACDMIVCAEDAELGLPEVRRGIIAAAGGVIRLPRALPRAVALEMIATGRPLAAARAHAFGLVNQLAPAAEVLERALDLARAVAENAPLAVRESLALARVAGQTAQEEMHRLNREATLRVMSSEDARIGPRAFVERRKPEWVGR